MNVQEPALSFRELFAYTDYLAARWLSYFERNPAALEVEIGGKTPKLRDLVVHIFQVEDFFLICYCDSPIPSRPWRPLR